MLFDNKVSYYIKKIAKYTVENIEQSTSLLRGNVGQALFLSHYLKTYKDPDINIAVLKILRDIELKLFNDHFSLIYSDGLNGILSALLIIEKNDVGYEMGFDFSDITQIFEEEIDKLLSTCLLAF